MNDAIAIKYTNFGICKSDVRLQSTWLALVIFFNFQFFLTTLPEFLTHHTHTSTLFKRSMHTARLCAFCDYSSYYHTKDTNAHSIYLIMTAASSLLENQTATLARTNLVSISLPKHLAISAVSALTLERDSVRSLPSLILVSGLGPSQSAKFASDRNLWDNTSKLDNALRFYPMVVSRNHYHSPPRTNEVPETRCDESVNLLDLDLGHSLLAEHCSLRSQDSCTFDSMSEIEKGTKCTDTDVEFCDANDDDYHYHIDFKIPGIGDLYSLKFSLLDAVWILIVILLLFVIVPRRMDVVDVHFEVVVSGGSGIDQLNGFLLDTTSIVNM